MKILFETVWDQPNQRSQEEYNVPSETWVIKVEDSFKPCYMTWILYIYLFIDNHLQLGAWQDLAISVPAIFPTQIQYQEPLSLT